MGLVTYLRIGGGFNLRIKLIDVGTDRNELNEPLAIETLAGVLKNTFQSQVRVDLGYLQRTNGRIAIANSYEYKIVGISTKINALVRTEAILNGLTENILKRNQIVVLGGLIATFAYQQLLEKYPKVLFVLGEGEEALEGITQAVLDYPDADFNGVREVIVRSNVPNIVMKRNDKVIFTERRLVCLKTVPKPSRNFLRIVVNRGGLVRLEASRGCSWGHCTFCGVSAKYGCTKWRPFPIRRIIGELEEISAAGGRYPYFTDEDFFGDNPQRAVDIADAIIAAKNRGSIALGLHFYINLPVKSVNENRFILAKLKESGLIEVFIGLESGSKNQLSRYGKRASVQDNAEAIYVLRELGLRIDIGFMMFDPEMTLKDLNENLCFLQELNLVEHGERHIKKVRVEPMTDLERKLKSENIVESLNVDSLSYSYSFSNSVIQKIFDEYEAWEKPVKEIVYSLQAQVRGEFNEEYKNKKMKLLAQIRRVDFEYLKGLVTKAEQNNERIQFKLTELTYERNYLISQIDSSNLSISPLTVEIPHFLIYSSNLQRR